MTAGVPPETRLAMGLLLSAARARQVGKMGRKEDDGFFEITSLHRLDLVEAGVVSEAEASKITDYQMEIIADKMADDYCEQLYWSSLKDIAEIVLGDSRKA